MSTLMRRSNPFGDILDWLESETSLARPRQTDHYIRVEDFTEDDTYVVRAEMPGIDPDKDVEITVEGDVLTIQGRRQEEEKDKHHSEFRYGTFTRALRLPADTQPDQIKARYADSVLEVRVPMAAQKQEVTKVAVQRADAG